MTEPVVSAPRGQPEAPRLSVLIPSWNAASTIERALASVLDERGVSLECVVIDDGSSDRTSDVVQAVADRDPRVVLLRIASNEGVSSARNHGLAVARGEWLAFLDADDRLLPGGVAALMRPTGDPDVLVVVGQRIWTDGERTWLSPVYDIPDITEPGRKSIGTHPGLLYYASATGKVLHRSVLDGLTFEGRVLGDQPWTIRAMLRAGDRIEVIGETVYEWSRPHPDRYVPTITAATRASADRATEMAALARTVFQEVSAEVDATFEDEASRLGVKRAYFDRLIRSDLAVPVRDAIDRRDPDVGRLYDTVARFLESVPPEVLSSSGALIGRIFRPPVLGWRRLPRSGRSGYWSMVRPALQADPRMAYRIGGFPLFPAFTLIRVLGAPVGTALGAVGMWAASLTWAVVGRFWRR